MNKLFLILSLISVDKIAFAQHDRDMSKSSTCNFYSTFNSKLKCEDQSLPQLPTNGVLPTPESAVKVAEIILINIYGEKVLSERPFITKLDGDYWIVDGTFHNDGGGKNAVAKGGTAHIEIRKQDGAVRKVIHGK